MVKQPVKYRRERPGEEGIGGDVNETWNDGDGVEKRLARDGHLL
jgi:hypothetical protein